MEIRTKEISVTIPNFEAIIALMKDNYLEPAWVFKDKVPEGYSYEIDVKEFKVYRNISEDKDNPDWELCDKATFDDNTLSKVRAFHFLIEALYPNLERITLNY